MMINRFMAVIMLRARSCHEWQKRHPPSISCQVRGMLVRMISNVAVLAFDGVAPFELGVLHEAWGYDRSDEGLPVFDFAICAPQGRPVSTQAGFGMTVQHDLGRAAEADLIAVPAGASGTPVPECVLDTVREGLDRGARIMSLCTGAFVLGEAGL